MAKFTPAQEESISVLVEQKLKRAVGWNDNIMSRERETVLKYYQGDAPKRQSRGNSSFVSTDVYDAVEGMKAQLLETFLANYDIVKFSPKTPADIESAREDTEYCSYVIHQKNDSHRVFTSAIWDGLTARVGVTKVYWEPETTVSEEEFGPIDEMSVQGLVAQEDVSDLEANLNPDGSYSGTLKRKKVTGKVCIEPVAPEEFSVEQHATDLSKRWACFHRQIKSIGELRDMGFDKKKLKDITWGTEDTLANSPEVLARFNQMDDGYRFGASSDGDADIKKVVLYEAYLPINFKDEDGGNKYVQVFRAGGVTLSIEEVDDHPFLGFVPLPIPHAFYGSNYAYKVVPVQNARTILMRSILDHSAITNTPRYMVLKGGLTNPRELLDNRLGGVVNITRPDAIIPMPQAALNPFVFEASKYLKEGSEETNGISALSQGLNKDAISTQNSADLVENLVSLSQTRQKIIARNFAYGYLIPLYLKVHDLIRKNATAQDFVQVAGNYVPVDPTKWQERFDAEVVITLGYNEQEKEAQKRIMIAQQAKQDPQLARMMGDQGSYNLAVDVLKFMGIKDYARYITDPKQLPPPQPDPMAVAHMQNEGKKADASLITAQATSKKVDNHADLESMKMALQKLQEAFNNKLAENEDQRKDADIANKIDVAQREMKLEEEAPQADRTTIVSTR
jgi:hypothetical protein